MADQQSKNSVDVAFQNSSDSALPASNASHDASEDISPVLKSGEESVQSLILSAAQESPLTGHSATSLGAQPLSQLHQSIKTLIAHTFFREELQQFESDFKELKICLERAVQSEQYECFDTHFFQKVMQLSQIKNPLKARRVVELYVIVFANARILERLCALSIR